MPHITKLFDKILLHRLRDAIDDELCCAQNGFRPYRGTVHHAAAGNMMLELAAETGKPLHGCFVDFSKAFDSVKWSVIVEQLRYWGAPEEFVRMTMSVMCGHTVRVRTDGILSDEIPIGVGVLQGDTLAPYLFVMVLDSVLRKLPTQEGALIDKTQMPLTNRPQRSCTMRCVKTITALGFADDVMLLSNTVPGLQSIFHTFEEGARELGLMVNMGPGKTEMFSVNDKPGRVCTSDGRVVPVVDSYKYLGINIFSYEKDFARRKKIAWGAVAKYKGTWKSNAPWDTKRALFSALVEPLLSYGLVAWPMTIARERQLDGLYSRMLRAALGLPPAFLSREYAPTERIYGPLPFFSEQMARRRVGFFGHALREHERGVIHPVIDILKYQSWKRRNTEWKGGGRRTVQRTLMLDCGVTSIDELLEVLRDRDECRATAVEAARETRLRRITDILTRRPPQYEYPEPMGKARKEGKNQ
jgi:hypothetical protein